MSYVPSCLHLAGLYDWNKKAKENLFIVQKSPLRIKCLVSSQIIQFLYIRMFCQYWSSTENSYEIPNNATEKKFTALPDHSQLR